jgi:hypothetical protein
MQRDTNRPIRWPVWVWIADGPIDLVQRGQQRGNHNAIAS